MSFITCDWSGTKPFRPSISPLSLVTSLARSPAAAGATGPAGCAVPARAAPPASVATATKITMVLSDARIAVLPSARSSRAFYRATRDMSVPPPAANTTTSHAGAFQNASRPKAARARPTSAGLRIALVHIG